MKADRTKKLKIAPKNEKTARSKTGALLTSLSLYKQPRRWGQNNIRMLR